MKMQGNFHIIFYPSPFHLIRIIFYRLKKKKKKKNILKQFQRFAPKHETLLRTPMYITQREIRFDHKNYSIMLNYSLLLLSVQQVFLYSKKKKKVS